MKSGKDFRGRATVSRAEDARRDTKLPPIKKSGKERHIIYSSLEEDDDADYSYGKKESVFDYFDDEEEL